MIVFLLFIVHIYFLGGMEFWEVLSTDLHTLRTNGVDTVKGSASKCKNQEKDDTKGDTNKVILEKKGSWSPHFLLKCWTPGHSVLLFRSTWIDLRRDLSVFSKSHRLERPGKSARCNISTWLLHGKKNINQKTVLRCRKSLVAWHFVITFDWILHCETANLTTLLQGHSIQKTDRIPKKHPSLSCQPTTSKPHCSPKLGNRTCFLNLFHQALLALGLTKHILVHFQGWTDHRYIQSHPISFARQNEAFNQSSINYSWKNSGELLIQSQSLITVGIFCDWQDYLFPTCQLPHLFQQGDMANAHRLVTPQVIFQLISSLSDQSINNIQKS